MATWVSAQGASERPSGAQAAPKRRASGARAARKRRPGGARAAPKQRHACLISVVVEARHVAARERGDLARWAAHTAADVQHLHALVEPKLEREVMLMPADGLAQRLVLAPVREVEALTPAVLVERRRQVVVLVDLRRGRARAVVRRVRRGRVASAPTLRRVRSPAPITHTTEGAPAKCVRVPIACAPQIGPRRSRSTGRGLRREGERRRCVAVRVSFPAPIDGTPPGPARDRSRIPRRTSAPRPSIPCLARVPRARRRLIRTHHVGVHALALLDVAAVGVVELDVVVDGGGDVFLGD